MILSRVIGHFRKQEWTAIAIDFVIVVAGVFVANQVANWNETRALREREKVYLEQLLIDLESDRVTGERGVASAAAVDDAAGKLLAALQDGGDAADIGDAELARSVLWAGYAYLPQGNTTTYNEMISTGALGHLKNPGLKRAFGEYYGRLSSGRQWDGLMREEQIAYRAAIRGLLTREQFAWARRNVGRPIDATSAPADFDRADFLERARTRPQIVDSLRSMGEVQQRMREDSRDMIADAEALAARIKAELGRP